MFESFGDTNTNAPKEINTKNILETGAKPDDDAVTNGSFLSEQEMEKGISPVDEKKLEMARSVIEMEIAKKGSNITLDNCRQVFGDILEKVKGNKMVNYEGIEHEVDFYMEIKFSTLYQKMRDEMEFDPKNREKIIEANRAHSKLMNRIEDSIHKNKDNPAEITKLWQRIEKMSSGNQINRKIGEAFKYGILAQMAAKELVQKLHDHIKEDVEIKIISATEDEDVFDQIDFWIETKRNGSVKRIPCQVKSLNLNGGTRMDIKDKSAYASQNVINFSTPDNSRLKYRYPLEEKMGKFFKRHGNKSGAFVLLPFLGNKIIREDGTTNDETADLFIRRTINHPQFRETFIP